MREQYMRTGEGFVICYSVTDRRSFEEALTYKRLVDRVRNNEDVPVVLVGNKCDLQMERKVCSFKPLMLLHTRPIPIAPSVCLSVAFCVVATWCNIGM